ncbi:PAAR domain-containing protein [Pseudomonas sp. SMV7]|uniref:PAAR domain-containing protein n=1 Tax=Pseudomonas sp. SMV7 TaxID=3390194 RepID=UPI003F8704CF
MSMRMNIFGRYQGLDGDETSTGAICIASQARGRVHGRNWLLQGDPTTPCPLCGQAGTIVEGEARWRQDGIPTALIKHKPEGDCFEQTPQPWQL